MFGSTTTFIPFERVNEILECDNFKNSEKTACQKVAAMVTSNLMDKHLLRQIVPR